MYLRRYGYLQEGHLGKEQVTKALKAFQQVAGIRDNGQLDRSTIKHMQLPRCGNLDLGTDELKRSERYKRFGKLLATMFILDQWYE